MTTLITKKNWIYWLLLVLAVMLMLLFLKSKMRSEKIDRQLKQGISRPSSIVNREYACYSKNSILLIICQIRKPLTIDDSRFTNKKL